MDFEIRPSDESIAGVPQANASARRSLVERPLRMVAATEDRLLEHLVALLVLVVLVALFPAGSARGGVVRLQLEQLEGMVWASLGQGFGALGNLRGVRRRARHGAYASPDTRAALWSATAASVPGQCGVGAGQDEPRPPEGFSLKPRRRQPSDDTERPLAANPDAVAELD